MATVRETMTRRGEGALIGWRAKAADAVASPVARRTPLDAEQVRAIVGWSFVALAALYLIRSARRMT